MAPFAPGFDARMIGGSKNVQRDSGKTLRTEYAAAVASSPDILGLISWNEFSENSYVEPSVRYGHQALDVLTDLRKAALPTPAAAVDSSDSPAATAKGSGSSFHIPGDVAGVIVFFVLFFGGIGLLRPVVRRRDEELGLLVRDQDGRPALPASQWRALPDGSAAPAPAPTPWGQPPGPAPLGTHDPWRALSGVPADPLQWDERAREGPDSPPEPPE
jgi:hypothetical protein